MDKRLTEKHIAQVAQTIPASSTKAFSDEFLELTPRQFDNATGTTKITFYDVISKSLSKWKESNANNNVGELRDKLKSAMQSDVITFTSKVLDKKDSSAELTPLLIGRVSRHIPKLGWSLFAIEYLDLNTAEMYKFLSPYEEGQFATAQGILTTWRNIHDHDNNSTVGKLLDIVEEAVDEGVLYRESITTLEEIIEVIKKVPTPSIKLDIVEPVVVDIPNSPISIMVSPDVSVAVAASVNEDIGNIAKASWVKCEETDYKIMGNITNMKEVLRLITNLQANTLKPQPIGIAIMDSGIYENHPIIRGHVDGSECFVESPGEKEDLKIDKYGHGTMCAGIILKYAPFARLYNVKVLDKNGNMTKKSIENGLKYINDNPNIHIVNMSFGGEMSWPAYSNLLSDIAKTKIPIAAATNNGKQKANSVGYPAQHGMVIGVGSYKDFFMRSDHSSVGPKVDFLCPGSDIPTTNNKGSFSIAEGTSFAAPHASAISALILAYLEWYDGESKLPGGSTRRELLTSGETMRRMLQRMSSNYPNRKSDEEGYGHLDPWSVLRDKAVQMNVYMDRVIKGEL